MELAQHEQPLDWRATWRAQAHAHPYTSLGLGLALAVVAWLLLASIWRLAIGEADAALRLGMLGGMAGFAATAVGALPALFLRGLSNRTEDTMLGLAAGRSLTCSTGITAPSGSGAKRERTGRMAPPSRMP